MHARERAADLLGDVRVDLVAVEPTDVVGLEDCGVDWHGGTVSARRSWDHAAPHACPGGHPLRRARNAPAGAHATPSPSRWWRSAGARSSGTSAALRQPGLRSLHAAHRLPRRAGRGLRARQRGPRGVDGRVRRHRAGHADRRAPGARGRPRRRRHLRADLRRRRRRRRPRRRAGLPPRARRAGDRDRRAPRAAVRRRRPRRRRPRSPASTRSRAPSTGSTAASSCFEPGALAFVAEDSVLERAPLRAPGRRRAAARLPPRGLLGLHGHLQGRRDAQRPLGRRASAPWRTW